MEIRKVAAPTTGDQNLLSDPVRVFQNRDTLAALSGFDRAHQTGSARSEDENVKSLVRRLSH